MVTSEAGRGCRPSWPVTRSAKRDESPGGELNGVELRAAKIEGDGNPRRSRSGIEDPASTHREGGKFRLYLDGDECGGMRRVPTIVPTAEK